MTFALAVAGGNIFVGNGTSIGEYTTSGATVNANLITGLPGTPRGLAVVGNDLFVLTTPGTIGEYTTSGATVNPSIISLSSFNSAPIGLAVFGNDMFVGDLVHGTIGEYTTSGSIVNNVLISGLNKPFDIVVVPEPNSWVLAGLGLALTWVRMVWNWSKNLQRNLQQFLQ